MSIHLTMSLCLFCRHRHIVLYSRCAMSRTVDPISDKVLFGELGEPSAMDGLKRRATIAQVGVENVICGGGYWLSVYQGGRFRLNVR